MTGREPEEFCLAMPPLLTRAHGYRIMTPSSLYTAYSKISYPIPVMIGPATPSTIPGLAQTPSTSSPDRIQGRDRTT